MIDLSRRGFLTGLASALAAPAIVRAESLMPVRAPKLIIPPRDLMVNIMATDRLLGLPLSLWIKQSEVDRVKAGLHPRYSNGWRVGEQGDFSRLAVPRLQ